MSWEEARNINWNEVIKKEARGKNDEDLAKYKKLGIQYILGTERIDKQRKILHTTK